MSPEPISTVLAVLFAASSAVIFLLLLFVTLRLFGSAWSALRQQAFDRRWEPVLYAWMDGEPARPPKLPRRHRLWLLHLWNRTRSFVEGEAVENLRSLAGKLGVADHAAALLQARAPWKRMLAIVTLGELRSTAHWRDLHALVQDPRHAVSLGAIEALVRIDHERAAPLVVPALVAREHWDPVRTGRLLKVLGAPAVEPLRAALPHARPGSAERTLRWLGLTESLDAVPVLRARLAEGDPGEMAVAFEALGRLGDEGDRELALGHLRHADWRVRMRAAQALGQLGYETDRAALEALLADPVWWVRYRAAGALYRLRGTTPDSFRLLAERHSDRYARDALLRVLTEQGA